jgi:colanic acid/amylovoran biosynthesis protein
VFDECGLTGHVADLRQLDAGALAERTAVSIASRAALKTQLAQILPGVKASAEATMDGLAQTLQALRA